MMVKAPVKDDTGRVIDEHGTHHETLAEFIGGELGLCGCGHAEAIVFLAWRALDLIGRRSTESLDRRHEPGHRERHRALWDQLLDLLPDTPQGELLLHVMDHAGWLEHGTSIRGSWLTPDGELALRLLAEHAALSTEWQAEIVEIERGARERGFSRRTDERQGVERSQNRVEGDGSECRGFDSRRGACLEKGPC